MARVKSQKSQKRRKTFVRFLPIYILMLPGLIYLFINNYMPLPGLVIAFKQYNAGKGIYGSPWVGLKNFEYLFTTSDAFVITRNTILYNVAFIVINTTLAIAVAIILSELEGKRKKVYQSAILLPNLLSTVIIGYLVFAFFLVRWIINLAPFGIMGLVFTNVSDNGLSIFTQYGRLLLLLVSTMLLMALVINPLIIFIYLHRNPYPLVLRCLRESGLTAFFTRSSAANIPVNMSLCEKLGLDKDIYSVSIPLGATINMDGAAITITIMTLAAANTLGMEVSLPAAILLSIMSALGACGASGVAGGSLLLIPMACSLFGISNDIAMQVVGVGFIIGVIQDSVETALNSAGDVEFAATAEYHQWLKEGKPLPDFMA